MSQEVVSTDALREISIVIFIPQIEKVEQVQTYTYMSNKNHYKNNTIHRIFMTFHHFLEPVLKTVSKLSLASASKK